MGLFGHITEQWKEARGRVLRREFEDTMARMTNANEYALRAFYSNIENTAELVQQEYLEASPADRKKYLVEGKRSIGQMWDRGDWPSALGAAVSVMHAESCTLPGEDAAHVRQETEKLIAKASAYFEDDGD